MNAYLAFFFGAMIALVGAAVLYFFASRNGFALRWNTPFMVDIGRRYAKRGGIDAKNEVDYIVMESLLSKGLAKEYYWTCWREGIFIPPPPPYEMVSEHLENEYKQREQERYKL
jgi:hypothetical protein